MKFGIYLLTNKQSHFVSKKKQARDHAEFIMLKNHNVQGSEQYKLQLSNAEQNDMDEFDAGHDEAGELEFPEPDCESSERAGERDST